MSSLGRLILLLVLVALVASTACWTTSRLLVAKAPTPTADFHGWLHTQLAITPEQERALEPEEARFAQQRKELNASIQGANAKLASTLVQDRDYTPRVQAAVEKVHRARSALEEATLRHILAMKLILTPDQFGQLLKLTSEALNNPANL